MSSDTSYAMRDRLRASYPNAELALQRFPSGAWMLDMRLGRRYFVISFSPREGYGFDEVMDGDGLTSSFSHAAAGFEELIEQITRML